MARGVGWIPCASMWRRGRRSRSGPWLPSGERGRWSRRSLPATWSAGPMNHVDVRSQIRCTGHWSSWRTQVRSPQRNSWISRRRCAMCWKRSTCSCPKTLGGIHEEGLALAGQGDRWVWNSGHGWEGKRICQMLCMVQVGENLDRDEVLRHVWPVGGYAEPAELRPDRRAGEDKDNRAGQEGSEAQDLG